MGWITGAGVGWVGGAELGRRSRGRDPTCDRYGGTEEPSVVANVRMCGIVLPVV